ncbi:MAG: MlaD family protein [Candidatus Omnitrophota bacterium]
MAGYSSSEVKSGVLIFVSIALLLGLTFVVGKFLTGETLNYQVAFGHAGGLENKAPVYFAGHEVGKVNSIEVRRGLEKPVWVTVSIRKDIELKEDSKAYIDTLGLMGEKFVELSPGTLASKPVPPGGQVTGVDPVPMHLLVSKMNVLADRMDILSHSLIPMTESLNDIMELHEEDIHKTIANLHEISANIRDMTHDLKYRPWRLIRRD